MSIDMAKIIEKLQDKRQIFCSEADFQLEMAWVIKEMYPDAKVRLEYVPKFNDKMHIDILVFISNKWIPIELKYKTKNSKKEEMIDKKIQEVFNLKDQGAKDISCYLYLKDIMRIESIKEQEKNNFKEGYAVFLTNDKIYLRPPQKNDCVYKEFSLEDGITKHGELKWAEHTGAGTKKGIEEPIKLKGIYKMKWKEFSNVDEEKSDGIFHYLVTKII
ncbi:MULTISPECIES: hypothetical protein [unclassified Helicobacter]|uniref:hypothetical protein n=1 Tax=unclassified Helicobacter TaxID=2593540 RepID=UPI000DCEE2CF|nr:MULTISPECIES: hypothetical protein [unclassified Helicobacter]MCI2236353.1 hypothetical protein [Helicobacter sp. CaF467b]RAX51836.1 hypothetical protein CCY98_06560 [Helicobacter sp. 11-8110]